MSTDSGLAHLATGVLADPHLDTEPTPETPPDAGEGAHLPGVGAQRLSLRQGLAIGGGAFTFWILLLINTLDDLGSAALFVLGPDISTTLGVSDGVIVFISSASAGFVVLGAIPLGWLGDRVRRGPIVGVCSAVFSAMVVATGLVVNAFQLFCARFVSGIAKAHTLPVHGSLIADTYPIGVRGRIGAAIGGTGAAVAALSPVLVGAVATAFGGVEEAGWRWAFILLGLPVGVLALLAFFIREPQRGRWERTSVLRTDEASVDPGHGPIAVEMAFARLGQIRTLRAMVWGLAAVGFQLFPMLSMANFFLEDRYGLDAAQRGLVGTASGLLTVVVIPIVGARYDEWYRRSPPRALRLVGYLLLPGVVLIPVQFSMPNPVLYTVVAIPITSLGAAAFAILGPTFQAVTPYRLRSLGIAYAFLYLFLVGAVGGSLAGTVLADSFGERWAIILLAVPTSLAGFGFLLRGSRSIDDDLAALAGEIVDEQEEVVRRSSSEAPLLQVADVNFSYGPVQVLFGVDLEVQAGETLALLGTNGAGKSTLLNVIAGLGMPSAGTVRLSGRTVTYATPEQRASLGIQLLPGGRGVFPTLSVRDNLDIGSYVLPPEVRSSRIERAWDLFPTLRDRQTALAGSLSGGQQQQLALARVLLHEPELLIIDELSLGLAPTVVGELLAILERLKAAGQTMLIVEQSISVAAAIAERAVFMEKGQVKFSGPTRELLERDDLARAVFLGGDPS